MIWQDDDFTCSGHADDPEPARYRSAGRLDGGTGRNMDEFTATICLLAVMIASLVGLICYIVHRWAEVVR